MHPAKSVIAFTVLSGAGFGLIFILSLGFNVDGGVFEAAVATSVAFVLSSIGLVFSAFHLGHPERAWRAFTQWRSSWLSREAILSVSTLSIFFLYSALWIANGHRFALLGILGALGAAATVFATGMIYAQLRTVPLWHRPSTPVCYLAFALASGTFLAGVFSSGPALDGAPVVLIAAVAAIVGWVAKFAWWADGKKATLAATKSTRETATGLGSIGAVRLLERPHTGPNYLTKEMVYVLARKHARKLRSISVALGLVIPVAVSVTIFMASISTRWLLLGWVSLIGGLFVERWLFFAEARHSVSLYY